MRSDRLYDARYRQRRRTHPIAAIVGLLVITLVTGGVMLAGGAYLGQALIAVAAPDASAAPDGSPDADALTGAIATDAARPDATLGATPTRRPRANADPTAGTGEVGGGDVDTPVDGPSATPAVDVTPAPTPRPWADLKPKPRRGPFQMDIYRDGTMAPEADPAWCVPAAMLTMINLVEKRRPITSAAEQQRLYNLARRHSTDKLTGLGAEPEGWAEGLNREGIGPYIVHVAVSRRYAIKEAARALRLTGRPVGILAWRGAHSMVLTGFKATADPAWTDDYEVTDVVIADVWWPRVSSIWGESLPPGTMESFERLAEDFLPWRRPDVKYPVKDGRYVLVLPVRKDGRYDPSKDA